MGRHNKELRSSNGAVGGNVGGNEGVKEQRIAAIGSSVDVIQFKGSVLYREMAQSDGWRPLTSVAFSNIAYKYLGMGTSKNVISDLEHYFRSASPDRTHMSRFIRFDMTPLAWDMRKGEFNTQGPLEDCVWYVPYSPVVSDNPEIVDEAGKIRFVMDLACGDVDLYDDIMQSLAPLLLERKPTGVIWFLGSGANGKSTLVNLLYKLFPNQLADLTVGQIEDERDTPTLNGKLGNICRESSEGFVEDSRTYKCIGTHEPFSVHKFHSQDSITIDGNLHHIFSANSIPTFGDKSYGARRRTLVVPFDNRFRPDESFESRTFTREFCQHFLAEMIRYADKLRDQNYRYQFHDKTTELKERYDIDTNTAQAYMDELIATGIRGFVSHRHLYIDYQNWCLENGHHPYKAPTLRAFSEDVGFARKSVRLGKDRDTSPVKMFLYKDTKPSELELVGGARAGLHILPEFKSSLEKFQEVESPEKISMW